MAMWAQKAGKLLSAAGKQEEVGMGPKLTGKETLKVQPGVLLEQLPSLPDGPANQRPPLPTAKAGTKGPVPPLHAPPERTASLPRRVDP